MRIPAFCTTRIHFAISATKNVPNYCGELAAGSAPSDSKRLPECFDEPRGERTRDDIGAAARRKTDQHSDGLNRMVLWPSDATRKEQGNASGCNGTYGSCAITSWHFCSYARVSAIARRVPIALTLPALTIASEVAFAASKSISATATAAPAFAMARP